MATLSFQLYIPRYMHTFPALLCFGLVSVGFTSIYTDAMPVQMDQRSPEPTVTRALVVIGPEVGCEPGPGSLARTRSHPSGQGGTSDNFCTSFQISLKFVSNVIFNNNGAIVQLTANFFVPKYILQEGAKDISTYIQVRRCKVRRCSLHNHNQIYRKTLLG